MLSRASGEQHPPTRLRQPEALRLAVIAVLLIVAALYVPALFADFVNIDDPAYVTLNPDVRHPHLVEILDPRHDTVSDWTPVVTLSHVLEYNVFGLWPLPYHAINVLLHLACTALLYLLLRDCGLSAIASAAAALIFGIHPLQVESVAWVSCRKNLLAALFGLLFLRTWLAGRPLVAAALLLLALGSKGTAVIFPLLAAVTLVFGFGALRAAPAIPWLALYSVAALGRAMLSAVLQAPVSAQEVGRLGLSGRMAVMGPVLATQLRQFFLPYDLCLRYRWLPRYWDDPRVLASWGLIAMVVGLVAWRGRHNRQLALGGCFAAIALLPVMNIVPAPDFQADRYTHLVLLGGSLLAVALVRSLARVQRWLPAAVLVAWCAGIAIPATEARIAVWQTSETLWKDTLRALPDFAFGWNQLAIHYLDHRQTAQAEDALRRVLVLEPSHVGARYNLALLLYNTGDTAEALRHAEMLVHDHPDDAKGQCLLGRALVAVGRGDEGEAHFDTAVGLDPTNASTRYARARAYTELGRYDAAGAELEFLMQSHPTDAGIATALAAVRLRQGRFDEALDLARRVTEADPHAAEAWDVRVQALLAGGDLDAAEVAVTRGLDADPTFADLHYRLAEVRTRRGDNGAARLAAADALRLLGSARRDWTPQAQQLAR